MSIKQRCAIGVFISLVSAAAFGQQNVLVNGDFELHPAPNFGNNIGWTIAPWVLGVGQQANVVKVDGPGGFDYGTNGPESDATDGNRPEQHYLDIADGSNSFYQLFTPRCSGTVRFGGAFSTRANSGGSAKVEIHQGSNGPSDPLIGATNSVTLPGGISKTDPWTNVSFTALLTAGQTYSFVVFMDNNLNFDNGFVIYADDCPAPDPCCPPWNTTSMKEMLVYHSQGGIAAPYTLQFTPSSTLQTQMQAYINYLNLLNPAITQITIQFRLHDGGTGTTPVTGAQLGVSHYITWTAGSTGGGQPPPTFFSGPPETMVINHWYVVHTGIYLENGQHFFGDQCANNDIAVRVQVQTLSRNPNPQAVLQIRGNDGRTVEVPLQ